MASATSPFGNIDSLNNIACFVSRMDFDHGRLRASCPLRKISIEEFACSRRPGCNVLGGSPRGSVDPPASRRFGDGNRLQSSGDQHDDARQRV